jgi:hypothetical protein
MRNPASKVPVCRAPTDSEIRKIQAFDGTFPRESLVRSSRDFQELRYHAMLPVNACLSPTAQNFIRNFKCVKPCKRGLNTSATSCRPIIQACLTRRPMINRDECHIGIQNTQLMA